MNFSNVPLLIKLILSSISIIPSVLDIEEIIPEPLVGNFSINKLFLIFFTVPLSHSVLPVFFPLKNLKVIFAP